MKDYRQFSSTRFVQLGLYASLKKKKGKKKERKKKRIPMHITRYTAENKESSFLLGEQENLVSSQLDFSLFDEFVEFAFLRLITARGKADATDGSGKDFEVYLL